MKSLRYKFLDHKDIYLPFIISSGVFSTIIIFLVISNSNKFGSFVYPIDDAYIHLSAAKNLAFYHIWGVGRVFSNFSSSPLYTLILFFLTSIIGKNILYPIIINSIFAFLINLFISILFKQNKFIFTTILIIFINALGNIYLQTLMGMEHVLHTFEFVLLIYFLMKSDNKKHSLEIIILFNIMIITRFESLFILLSFFIVYFKDNKYITSKILFLSSITFIMSSLIGKYILGGNLLANSLLIKGNFIKIDSLKSIINFIQFSLIDRSILSSPLKFGLFPIFISLFIFSITSKNNLIRKITLLWMFSTILNSIFGSFGWLYRYEMYLIVSGIVIIFINVSEINFISFAKKEMIYFYLVISIYIILPLIYVRGYKYGYKIYHESTKAIFNQHVFLSSFVNKFLSKNIIAVNDIGAISYFSESKIIDFSGLCNNDVLYILQKYGWEGYYDHVYSLMKEKNVDYFLIYKGFINTSKMKNFYLVGKFIFDKEEITGGNEVFLVSKNVKNFELIDKIKNDTAFSKSFVFTNE